MHYIQIGLIPYKSVGLEQSFELIELDLTWSVLINLLDQFLDIDGHLKLLFNGSDKLRGVNTPFAIWLSAHGHECL